jgi:CO/xanthine dehydrogenase Mo-binding subunit
VVLYDKICREDILRHAFQLRARAGCSAPDLPCRAWLRINVDGSATIFAGKVELGQGILTALQQIAAEELVLCNVD